MANGYFHILCLHSGRMHHQLTVTWHQVKETIQDLLSGEEYVDYKSNEYLLNSN